MIGAILGGSGRHRLKVTEYINQNLKTMVEVFRDIMYEDDPESLLPYVLPRDYIKRHPSSECIARIEELYEIIVSTSIRDYIEPLYEYILYHIAYFWRDMLDDADDVEYIPHKLTDDLSVIIREEYDEETLTLLQDFDDMVLCAFHDLDFLPGNLDDLIMLYLNHPNTFNRLCEFDYLDDYVELMPVDLRIRYEKERERRLPHVAQGEGTYERLFEDVKRSCVVMQKDQLYWDASEDQKNTNVANMLTAAGWFVKDQTRSGSSASGKQAGEVDILVYRDGLPFSVIEAFHLHSLDTTVIDDHLNRVFLYDVFGLAENYILVYSKVMS